MSPTIWMSGAARGLVQSGVQLPISPFSNELNKTTPKIQPSPTVCGLIRIRFDVSLPK
jgi:hypothetical protein